MRVSKDPGFWDSREVMTGRGREELRGLSKHDAPFPFFPTKSKFSGIGNSRMVLNAHHSTTVFRRVC